MKLNDDLTERLAARFAALADPNRLRIIQRLQAGDARVGELAADLGLLQPNVSRHCKVLVQAGLIELVRAGDGACYTIRDQSLNRLCELVCGAVRAQADEDHARLTAR